MKSKNLSQYQLHGNRMDGVIGGILMVLALDQIIKGKWAWVTDIDTDPCLRKRLCDFGLVPGTRVRCRYASPLGDVLAIELRESVIALRKHDAHRILVRV